MSNLQSDIDEDVPSAPDLSRAIEECLAFKETVDSRPAIEIAKQGGSASELLLNRIAADIDSLRLKDVLAVSDLPVILATFGYTRRTFEPTYNELTAKNLPTRIRPFPSLTQDAARRLGRPELAGAVPILAKEGEHEGILLSLDPHCVIKWLQVNGIVLENTHKPPIVRIMQALEPVDRYYDDVWQCRVRRFVFGLVHSLSHAAMRVASRFAGLERTSISEYIFLPLLATVIFDNSSSFKLGGMETLARDHLATFLDELDDDGMTCLYDTQCIDHVGACHGCLHSPEISCRVFNHGLSRAFLIGGHTPWVDIATDQQIVGYWQV